jgi:hypothetical protein
MQRTLDEVENPLLAGGQAHEPTPVECPPRGSPWTKPGVQPAGSSPATITTPKYGSSLGNLADTTQLKGCALSAAAVFRKANR